MSQARSRGNGELRYAPADLTATAPHVRSSLDVPRLMGSVVVALLPCLGVALYNTGYQANLALAGAGGAELVGWREGFAELVGAGRAPASPWDCVVRGALIFAPLLAVSLAAGALWERLFARLRRRPVDHAALPVIGLLFALCLPPTLPPWQAALGSSVGVVVGKEIFGGIGRNFVNPALAGLAFLYFAYPGSFTGAGVVPGVDGVSGATPLAAAKRGGLAALEAARLDWWDSFLGLVPGAMGETSALACLLGGGLLLYAGAASWRILAGGILGSAAAVWALQLAGSAHPMAGLPWHWHAVTGGFAFGLVFLATDPVTAAMTDPGRWLYGALIGFAAIAIRVANPAHQEGILLAVLLGNVAAPLLDHAVTRVPLRRRDRRDG